MAATTATVDVGRIRVDRSQLDSWAAGDLPLAWHERYPFLFDDDDLRLTRKQNTYHFFEWLGAIVLHHTTGYHALVEKYEFKAHPRKQKILKELLSPHLIALVCDTTKRAQCPDLLMYAPDHSDWFFCEAKGPRDTISSTQLRVFEALAGASGRPVQVLRFFNDPS